jgi:hypothetical protein
MIFSKRTYLIIVLVLVPFLFIYFSKPITYNFTFINVPENKIIWANTDSAITQSVIIPDVKQIKEGKLIFKFNVINPLKEPLYYKLYYLNTSYYYNENNSPDYLFSENFYGSWNDFSGGFKPLGSNLFIKKTDSIQIVGNPLDDPIYFGAPYSEFIVNKETIDQTIQSIKAQPEWFEGIRKKAIQNKLSLETQLTLDAEYVIKGNRNFGTINHRWKRNPRMGNYSFLLVVCSEKTLKKIPAEVQDIRIKGSSNKYINPFYYFNVGDGKYNLSISKASLADAIQVKAKLNPANGIYVDFTQFPHGYIDSCLNNKCNNSETLFNKAHFEQFFHTEVTDFKLRTIPLIKDILTNEYTVDDYLAAKEKYKNVKRVEDYIKNTRCPCKTVTVKNNTIEIKNPGNQSLSNARKENVGVKTRIGFTYGKITALVDFPPLLNKSGLWTGITNAVWLLYQDNANWNNRRWSSFGYYKKGESNPNAPRLNTTPYSEIDFEIVKTSKYWPACSYGNKNVPYEDASKNRDVIVATTNWDLACKDPKEYFVGVHPFTYKNETFYPHRWFETYQAVTNRYPIPNDELFNGPTYYQIEWNPTEIIWRIGKDKNNLKTVGYVNERITSIPNNQMILVITQEYHLANWWPPIVYDQDYLPFPKNDIVGKVISVEIE